VLIPRRESSLAVAKEITVEALAGGGGAGEKKEEEVRRWGDTVSAGGDSLSKQWEGAGR